jgi:hypothetical protein
MPGSARPEKKQWTVLAYIVADHKNVPAEKDDVASRIDEIAFEEVTGLLWSADRAKVNVAVQIDFSRLSGVYRVIANSNGVEKTTLPEEHGAGRVDTFTDYVREVARQCPAEHYLLLIWGHGEGPIGFFSDAHGGDLLPSADKTLSLPELAKVLAFAASAEGFGQKVDILLGKSCSLATIEAAYELTDGVDFMVCSQAIVPLRAWHYDEIFKVLDADVERTARGLLDALDHQFEDADARMGRAEVPYSIIRPSLMPKFGPLMKALVTALSAAPASLLQSPLLDAIDAASHDGRRALRGLGAAAGVGCRWPGEPAAGILPIGRSAGDRASAARYHLSWHQRLLPATAGPAPVLIRR